MLSGAGRDSGFGLASIRLEAVLDLLKLYSLHCPENLEKIMMIENTMFPILQAQQEEDNF